LLIKLIFNNSVSAGRFFFVEQDICNRRVEL